MKIIDIGCNLMSRSFDANRMQIVEAAEKAGVSPLIITGSNEQSSDEAQRFASGYPAGKLYSTAGVHPHDVKHCNEHTIDTLRTLAQNACVVAIGECGLDYNREYSPREVQREWFGRQIDLACELGLPLFLHERDAFDDFYALIARRRNDLKNLAVHCFTGTERELEKYVELDCYIGITGWICDERRGLHLRELVRKIPSDRLMIETDAPYLIPRNMPGRPRNGINRPEFLVHIAADVASCTGKNLRLLAEETYNNSCRFFGIDSDG
jgi:TatD DNase family protein